MTSAQTVFTLVSQWRGGTFTFCSANSMSLQIRLSYSVFISQFQDTGKQKYIELESDRFSNYLANKPLGHRLNFNMVIQNNIQLNKAFKCCVRVDLEINAHNHPTILEGTQALTSYLSTHKYRENHKAKTTTTIQWHPSNTHQRKY